MFIKIHLTVKNYFLVRMDILVFQFEVESQGLFLKQSQISFVNNHSVRLLYYWFSFKKVCNFKTCMGSYRQKIICTQSLSKLMSTEYSKMLIFFISVVCIKWLQTLILLSSNSKWLSRVRKIVNQTWNPGYPFPAPESQRHHWHFVSVACQNAQRPKFSRNRK